MLVVAVEMEKKRVEAPVAATVRLRAAVVRMLRMVDGFHSLQLGSRLSAS